MIGTAFDDSYPYTFINGNASKGWFITKNRDLGQFGQFYLVNGPFFLVNEKEGLMIRAPKVFF